MSEENHSKKPSFISWARGVLGLGAPEGSLQEALEEVLEEHEESGKVFSLEEKDMLRNMLHIGELTVHDVMIPRTEIIAVEYDVTLSELKKIFMEQRHTRMPVYDENLDKLKGFIHLKDLVPAIAGDEVFDLDAVLRKVMFVAPSMRMIDLLVQMRVSGDHMAIVVDEYGGTDGLVTLEDLFEEIVGEIQDEHDEYDVIQSLKRVSYLVYEADARLRLDELEDALHIKLILENEEVEVDTIGGLMFLRLGRVPARGEVVDVDGVARLEVLEADPRRIRKIRIVLPQIVEAND